NLAQVFSEETLQGRLEEATEAFRLLTEDVVLEVFPKKLSEETLGRVFPPDSRTIVFPGAKQLAAGIVQEYTHFYASDYTLADVSTDIAALDLSGMEQLVSTLRKSNGLTDLMTLALRCGRGAPRTYFEEQNPPYAQIRDAIVLAHWEAQGYKDEQN